MSKNILDMVRDPKCSSEILSEALERFNNGYISYKAAENSNCPSEALQKVLERRKDDLVSRLVSRNPNCPPQARLQWLIATGRIKTPDLSKHDVQVIKDNNKPDEEWEQFKRMVEDE